MKPKIPFNSLNYSSISELRTMKEENVTVKFRGHIEELKEAVFEKSSENEFALTSSATFVDDEGRSIDSFPIRESRYHALEDRMFRGEPTEVIGVISKSEQPPKRKNQSPTYINKVQVLRTRSGDRPCRILEMTDLEKGIVEKFLAEIRSDIRSINPWAMFDQGQKERRLNRALAKIQM